MVRRAVPWVGLAAGTWALALWRPGAAALWPPVVALAVILVVRRALAGLLAGALAGAVILHHGDPVAALTTAGGILAQDMQSDWKVGALAFTILLGGFAAVLESAGGLETLLRRWARDPDHAERGVETAAGLLGLVCFFDGLANSLVVGRVSRDLADRHGVARVKLAYIVDSTSSAVACVAVISTWIAFQLTLIETAFRQAHLDVNPYRVYLASLPANFYCWFTLVMLAVAIRYRYHPGPMARYCAAAGPRSREHGEDIGTESGAGPWRTAVLPLAVLLAGFPTGFILLGAPRPLWPLTRDRILAAFGSDAGPVVLVTVSAVALAAALAVHPGGWPGRGRALKKALAGMAAMAPPLLILLAAWILGGVMDRLGTSGLIAGMATGTRILPLLPAVTFLTGAVLSFSTGTSWGTMGILFPLTVPAAASLGAEAGFLHLVVAAVFSGAVFGDHCSPFSDTTIVTSVSCGVTPDDHVRTQLPYAFQTAAVALLAGFLPAGFGISPWLLLPAGAAVLVVVGAYRRGGNSGS